MELLAWHDSVEYRCETPVCRGKLVRPLPPSLPISRILRPEALVTGFMLSLEPVSPALQTSLETEWKRNTETEIGTFVGNAEGAGYVQE